MEGPFAAFQRHIMPMFILLPSLGLLAHDRPLPSVPLRQPRGRDVLGRAGFEPVPDRGGLHTCWFLVTIARACAGCSSLIYLPEDHGFHPVPKRRALDVPERHRGQRIRDRTRAHAKAPVSTQDILDRPSSRDRTPAHLHPPTSPHRPAALRARRHQRWRDRSLSHAAEGQRG